MKEKDKYERMKCISKSENENDMSNNNSYKPVYKIMWVHSTCQGLKTIECILTGTSCFEMHKDGIILFKVQKKKKYCKHRSQNF